MAQCWIPRLLIATGNWNPAGPASCLLKVLFWCFWATNAQNRLEFWLGLDSILWLQRWVRSFRRYEHITSDERFIVKLIKCSLTLLSTYLAWFSSSPENRYVLQVKKLLEVPNLVSIETVDSVNLAKRIRGGWCQDAVMAWIFTTFLQGNCHARWRSISISHLSAN